MQQVTETVKQGVKDAASLAVGAGVLGYQAAQARVETAQVRVGDTAKGARAELEHKVREAREVAEHRARQAWDQLEAVGSEVIERIEPVIARVSDRVEPLLSDIAEKVEPVVDRIQARAQEFGKRLPGQKTPAPAPVKKATAAASKTTD
jgi:hypothetical protein